MDEPIDDVEEADEEEPQEEKTPGDEPKNQEEDKGEDDKDKTRRADIAKKKHWRDKAQKASARVQELEEELVNLRSAVKKPDDDKEAAAQEYIRTQAREVYKELQLVKAKEEQKDLESFEQQIQEILDDNPDVAEEELLDTIEEYEVEPSVALRFLKKQADKKEVKKPKMPTARRASPEQPTKTPDDSKKSMWQIAKEEAAKVSDALNKKS